MKFNSTQFTPTKWDTVDDKEWFANQFAKFVESGFNRRHFTERFYRRLSNTFGHIAHCNRLGFWETYFTTTAGKVRFLEETLAHPCYGHPDVTYSDVERALRIWLTEEETLEAYQQQLASEIQSAERAQFEHLRNKLPAKGGPAQAIGNGADKLSELFTACEALAEFSFDEARLQTDYAQALAEFCRLKRTLRSALNAAQVGPR